MADNKSNAPRNPRGVAATKPPKVVIYRHQHRTRSVGTNVPFTDDSAELDDRARARLDQVIPLLLGKPNKVEVHVYTPRQPLKPESSFQDHWQLSYARCQATMTYLVAQGIERERIRMTQDGEIEPFTPAVESDSEAGSFPV